MIRDLIALENTSKVWIYQAEREFNYDELACHKLVIQAIVVKLDSGNP